MVQFISATAVPFATNSNDSTSRSGWMSMSSLVAGGLLLMSPAGACTAPSTISAVAGALNVCKLNAPSTSYQVKELMGHCDDYFYAESGYMRFVTTDERSELRCPENDDVSDGFVVEEATASWSGTVRLGSPVIGEADDYTFMQLHGEDTSYIRLAHYGRKNLEGIEEDAYNHIWMFIKFGSSSSNDLTSLSLGEVPSGDFEASIVLPGDGTVTVSANGNSHTFDIDWSDTKNYFKAGVYVQDGNPSDFPVDYKTLSYSLEAGENFL